jgi:hypothetical protein
MSTYGHAVVYTLFIGIFTIIVDAISLFIYDGMMRIV